MKENDLHEYQVACVKHIEKHPYCGVFLDMGLGKTVSTLTAVEHLMYDSCSISSVLVIAPKRVVESVWDAEGAKWEHLQYLSFVKIHGSEKQRKAAMLERADVYLVSRDNIAWLCQQFNYKLPYDMVVIDELSSFKSSKSQRFKAMRKARPYIKRLVGLTGTPAPNSLIDLWAQLYLIDLGSRLGRTITSYRNTYFVPNKTNGHVVFSYKLISGADKEIHSRISDICISMSAEDYLKMPDRTDNFIKLEMPDDLKKQYKDFERDKVMELISGSESTELAITNAATLANKLLQFANGAMYDEERNVHELHDLKLDALEEIVEDANGSPILVAWTYQFDRDRIMERLKKHNPRELKTAKDIADWNGGRVSVMLAHPASAGHGLNLQAGGNVIVWYGLTWSLELYQQFNARLFRQGQTHGVVINHLVVKGTHDEDVVYALRNKQIGQDALMNSLKAKIERYKNAAFGAV